MTGTEIIWTAIVAAGLIPLNVKIIFDWLKGRDSTKETKTIIQDCPLDRSGTIQDIKWIKEVHQTKDTDGTFMWYTPRSAIYDILEHTKDQNKILETMGRDQKNLLNEMLKELKKQNGHSK